MRYWHLITNYGEFAICAKSFVGAKAQLRIELKDERNIGDLEFIN